MDLQISKKTDSGRVRYFDALRLFAMFLIYATHFIARFCPEYMSLWREFPTAILLKGVTGKFGVVLFGVILGYFAYLSKETNSTRYVVKRYAYFAIGGFAINILYVIAGWCLPGIKERSIIKAIIETITLGDGVYATYWCIRSFFLASVISHLNRKANVSGIVILAEIFMFAINKRLFLSICLIGNLVAQYQDNKCLDFLKHRIVRIAFWIFVFFAIKRSESNLTYFIQAWCCAIMVLLIIRGNIIQKILNNRFLAYIGGKGMGVFLLHPLLYSIFGPIFFKWFENIPYPYAFCITMLICFAIIVLASIPLVWAINKSSKFVADIAVKFEDICIKKQQG